MISFEKTDVGVKRRVNQDSVFSSDSGVGKLPNLYIVADGMGGELAGDYASAKCVEIIVEEIKNSSEMETVRIFEKAIQLANNKIYSESKSDPTKAGMGTTLVLATVFAGHLYVANVGDSRLYVATSTKLKQVTKDHSVVAELVRRGELDEAGAKFDKRKNQITRAVGAEEKSQLTTLMWQSVVENIFSFALMVLQIWLMMMKSTILSHQKIQLPIVQISL